jgi:hypothetical protein
MVAHTYNHRYVGGRDCDLRPAPAQSVRPYQPKSLAYWYNASYSGGIYGGLQSKLSPGQKSGRPYLKNNQSKKGLGAWINRAPT